jgi:phosphoadenosine phosphosulfate reductase
MTATLYRNGAFEADDWTFVDEETALSEVATRAVVLPLGRLLEDVGDLDEGVRLAVLVRAGEDINRLAPHLARLEMVAIDFKAFSDGRGYSSARILRQRMGFSGEVRAVGDVLLDQIPLMRRVGFDAFAITHEPTRRALQSGHSTEVPLYLQPVGGSDEVPAGARAWARRPANEQQY